MCLIRTEREGEGLSAPIADHASFGATASANQKLALAKGAKRFTPRASASFRSPFCVLGFTPMGLAFEPPAALACARVVELSKCTMPKLTPRSRHR